MPTPTDLAILRSGDRNAIQQRILAVYRNRGMQVGFGNENDQQRLVRLTAAWTADPTYIDRIRADADRRRPTQAPAQPDPTTGSPTPGSPAPPPVPTDTAGRRDAQASIRATLDRYGLGDLAGWAWEQVLAGRSEAEIMLDLWEQPRFKQEYPEIEARRAAGLAPLSPAEIISYRRSARQVMRSAGLPEGFYDSKDDFTKFLVEDVSLQELQSRIDDGYVRMMEAPAEARQAARDLYGLGDGDLLALALDPDVAVPVVRKRVAASLAAGTALRSGFGSLQRTEAERLADLGVTPEQAAQGFGTLYESRELMGTLPGERGEQITREQQLGATFGDDAQSRERLSRRARERVAQGRSGGRFAGDDGGFGGLGVAS